MAITLRSDGTKLTHPQLDGNFTDLDTRVHAVAQGGTGASTEADARTNLGLNYAATTLTFSSVAGVADGTPQNWAHGLGSGEVDFDFVHVVGTISSQFGVVVAMDSNGYTKRSTSATTQPTDPVYGDRPAAGNIRVNVRNNSGTTSTILVKIRAWSR